MKVPFTRSIWAPLLLAFVLRLAMYPFSKIEDPMTFEYGSIAEHLVAGQGYSITQWMQGANDVPSAWMPPGQPYIIAGFYLLFGKTLLAHQLLFLLNALLGTCAVYVLGRIAKSISPEGDLWRLALYAAAVFPPFVFASGTWGVASSVLFLNGLLLLKAIDLSRALPSESGKESLKQGIQFGLVAGILTMFRAEAPLTIFFLGLALIYLHRERMQKTIVRVLVSGLVVLAIMSPWLISNYARFDRLILGSTSGGYNLWRGNNETATGGGWTATGMLIYPSEDMERSMKAELYRHPLNEFEPRMNTMYTELALSWIKANPVKAFGLAIKKAFLIWVLDWYHPSDVKYVYGVFQVLAFLLFLLGMRQARKLDKRELTAKSWLYVTGAACLAMTLVTMIFFSLPRYQIFLVGLYFPVVVLGLDRVLPERVKKMLLSTAELSPEESLAPHHV